MSLSGFHIVLFIGRAI